MIEFQVTCCLEGPFHVMIPEEFVQVVEDLDGENLMGLRTQCA